MKKMVSIVNVVGFALVALTPVVVSAANARLNSTGSVTWTDASKWVGGYVPMNSDDVVDLSVEGKLNSSVYLTPPKMDFSIDSIIGCNTYVRMIFDRTSAPYRIGARQLSGYTSLWPIGFNNSNDGWKGNTLRTGLNLLGSSADPTIVNSYYLGCLPEFGTPAAANAGRIRRLVGTGTFLKDGAGELTVEGPVGLLSGVFLQEGRLTLSADHPVADDVPAAGAIFHVDASRADTLLTAVEGGATVVTNWTDASGGDVYAYWESYTKSSATLGKPRIAERTANGRRLVDFGRFAQFDTGIDPDAPAAWLNWSCGEKTNVREAFFAAILQDEATIYNSSSAATPAPIGFGSSNINMTMMCDDRVLFTESDANKADARVNGEPVMANGTRTPYNKMRIVSIAFNEPIGRASAFGRRGSTGAGGFLLGEALVYDRALTEAERRQTIDYLKKRWLDAETLQAERTSFDIGSVVVKSSAADVAVPDGKTVRVRKVVDAEGDGIVKEGDGTLEVEVVEPSDAKIVVNSGTFKFAAKSGNVQIPASLPSDAAFHFDASDDDSFTYESDNLVTQWRDVRSGSSLVATNLYCDGTRTDCPVRRASVSPTGLPAVDFYTTGIGSANKFAPRFVFDLASVHEGFIVWKNTCPGATSYPSTHFACTETSGGMDCFQSRDFNNLLNWTYSRYLAPSGGALWTVNGRPVNPFDGTFGTIGGEGNWVVIHFTSAYPLAVNGMAVRGSHKFGGGCMIGELVGYERLLTDAERRGIEAYLMNRWLGETHPDAKPWTGDLAFGAGAVAKIDTEVDLVPSSVSAAGASLEKAGTGTLTLSTVSTNVAAISVSGGELSAGMSAFNDFADAFVHFDASDTNSFEMTSNGDGTYSVTKWYDVRGNGIYAEADMVTCRAKPQYKTAAATGLAEGAPGYVDFGPISICGPSPTYAATNDLSSAMTWNVTSTNVHEVHVVYADNIPFKDGSSAIPDPVAYYNGYRGGTNQSGIDRLYSEVLVYRNSSDGCCLCEAYLNGEEKDMHYKKPAGFGVVTVVVTNFYPKEGLVRTGAWLNTFTNSRRTQYGGCRVAEVIVYDQALSSERRAAVDDYLMKKWLGLGDGMTVRPQGPSISVAAGATARLSKAEFVDLASLTVDIDASGVAGALKVEGVFHAPATFSLTVNIAQPRRLGGRTFKLIDADEIADAANIGGWTVNVGGGQVEHRVFVDADGDVAIEFLKRGSILTVR